MNLSPGWNRNGGYLPKDLANINNKKQAERDKIKEVVKKYCVRNKIKFADLTRAILMSALTEAGYHFSSGLKFSNFLRNTWSYGFNCEDFKTLLMEEAEPQPQ